ncbi:MAG: acyl-CoA/acyl-ACP dehydrogenase [Burkholderiales bacterium]|nr:acyl-CoA/acyl-ACP dehydrogenase [Phycisphaerae bacterium]
MIEADPDFTQVLTAISQRATENDIAAAWPQVDLDELAAIGAMRWAIGRAYGGDDLDALELHDRYELIASASLATALVLSQRDTAAGYLEASTNDDLKNDLLPKLARNELWTTIGISHLTTSTQSGTLIATPEAGGYVIDGTIPWATGGTQSQFVVAGAKTTGSEQLIFALPVDRPGVTRQQPIKLATLAAAPTGAILCQNVKIETALVIAGPAERALAKRTKSLPIGQVFAALGLTRTAMTLIAQIDLPSAAATLEALQRQFGELSESVRQANSIMIERHDLQTGPLLRSECNSLAIRAAHAAVTLYKGAGLRVDHPAQRLARECLFLLVWSSPMSVMDRNLELISETH